MCLARWGIALRGHFASPKIQNQVVKIYSNTITKEIPSLPVVQYSLIIDGKQDTAGFEHFVDKNLQPREKFVGLYQVTSTTKENIASVAKGVLIRLHLPLSQLQGQTYDGAANVSGRMLGVQAHLKKEHSLAVYVNCGLHCLNLITQAVCVSSSIIRDSLQFVYELGVLFNQSGKFKAIFTATAKSDHTSPYTSKAFLPRALSSANTNPCSRQVAFMTAF